MVYDKRPRRESQAPPSHEQQTGSSSRNIYRSIEPSPIIEQLRQRWIDKRQARKEMEWFDSLPVLDPNRRKASSTFDATEKARTKTPTQRREREKKRKSQKNLSLSRKKVQFKSKSSKKKKD